MNNCVNNIDKTEKNKLVFLPLFLFAVRKSENFLRSMEQKGWILYRVRFGCLLYFAPCKFPKDAVYYITQFTRYRFGKVSWTYGKKALTQMFLEREINKSAFLSFSINGLGYSKLYFTVYRFENNQDAVNICKKKRVKDISYFVDILLYICVNIFGPLLLIFYLAHLYN